jgi:nanoRNase/pAp phosphatase (c-di-AMP/oligoRNAs hydrolase)
MASGKKIVVLYHGGCADGFGGAWAAWKKLGKRAEYIPLYDRQKPPSGLKDKRLYFIDWTFDNPAIIQELVKTNERVIILDHHEHVEKIMRLAQEHVFSSVHSGAALAWKYFHPRRRMPLLLKYVEDYDLWKFRFRDTAAVNALIEATPFDFREWSRLASDFEKPESRRRRLAVAGAILQYKNSLVRDMVSGAKTVRFGKYEVLALNAPILRNEAGHILAKRKPPFSVLWWEEGDKIRISLRAVKPFNLLKNIKGAKGHPQAAGFTLPLGSKLPWRDVRREG